MYPQERECPQCGDAVEGRANKIFCSASCRAQHFRNMQDDADDTMELGPHDVPTIVPNEAPASLPSLTGYTQPAQQWIVEYERTQKAIQEAALRRREAAVCDRLHQSYSIAITNFLQLDGKAVDRWSLENKMGELERLSTEYRTHPHMREPGSQVPDRLEDLYWLYDKLRRLLLELQTPPAPGVLKAYSITFELSAKRRARFRTNLLRD